MSRNHQVGKVHAWRGKQLERTWWFHGIRQQFWVSWLCHLREWTCVPFQSQEHRPKIMKELNGLNKFFANLSQFIKFCSANCVVSRFDVTVQVSENKCEYKQNINWKRTQFRANLPMLPNIAAPKPMLYQLRTSFLVQPNANLAVIFRQRSWQRSRNLQICLCLQFCRNDDRLILPTRSKHKLPFWAAELFHRRPLLLMHKCQSCPKLCRRHQRLPLQVSKNKDLSFNWLKSDLMNCLKV